MAKRAREVDASDSSVVELNVGGTVFTTTLGTLRFEQDSMLARKFAEDSPFGQISTDKDGRPFVDRDPLSFAVVLDYLRRGGRLVRLPSDDDVLERKLP